MALRGFAEAQKWLECTVGIYHLVRVDVPFTFELGRWILKLRAEKWIYLVKMKGLTVNYETVDHCVVMDGQNDRIIDSTLQKRMYITAEALQSCVPENYSFEEARRLVVQPKRKGSRKRRRTIIRRGARRKK